MDDATKKAICDAFKASKKKQATEATAFNLQNFLSNLMTVVNDVGPLVTDIISVLVAAGLLKPTPAPAPTPTPAPTD